MDIVPVVERHDAAPLVMDVVGPVCESSDFLGRARELAVREGDWIAVCDAGAYGASMASRYNSRMLPMEVMIDGERVLPLRTPDTFDEMVRGEVLLELCDACRGYYFRLTCCFSKQPRKMGKRRISETLPRCGVFLCLQTGPCPNAQTEGVSHAS